MEKYNIGDVLFLDVETTGLPEKSLKWDKDFEKFPFIVQISWSFGDKEADYIIQPEGYSIPNEVAIIHGITTEIAIKKGVLFREIIDELMDDAKNAGLICAHNIYFDVSILKANILRYCGSEYYDMHAEDSLHKSKRIDTMKKTIKFVGALRPNGKPGKFPRLEELYEKLFPGEKFAAHNSMEDVRALRRCLPKLVDMGIIDLEKKEYE